MNALTWDDLATVYDKLHRGRKARTLPVSEIFDWAEQHPDIFFVDNEGYIYLKEASHEGHPIR